MLGGRVGGRDGGRVGPAVGITADEKFPPILVGLLVSPPFGSLPILGVLQLAVTAAYDSAPVRNVTNLVTYVAGSPLITVSLLGLVVGVSLGSTGVSVQYGGISTNVPLTVTIL